MNILTILFCFDEDASDGCSDTLLSSSITQLDSSIEHHVKQTFLAIYVECFAIWIVGHYTLYYCAGFSFRKNVSDARSSVAKGESCLLRYLIVV